MSESSRYDRSQELFVIVRVDLFQLRGGHIPEDPWNYVTVKEVVETEERAVAEVQRLSEVNAGKDVAYFFQPGRILPPER
jgi:hypothetical protein